MQPDTAGSSKSPRAGGRIRRRAVLCAVLISALAAGRPPAAVLARAQAHAPAAALPDAPQAQTPAKPAPSSLPPCKPVKNTPPGQTPSAQSSPQPCRKIPNIPVVNWFARFLTGPAVKPLSPAEKARLAARNFIDPFNAVTILGTSAFSVAADSHSAFGPGMTGFGRYVGVSYSEDLTGEFFGTFLIPSIVHQDPHYHRMPSASIAHRLRHTVVQVFWTKGDNGGNMVNYANIVGFAMEGAISNTYVPGQDTRFPASATRYALGLATAPAENLITEFLPDIARHIHIRVVIIQRIINQAALSQTNQ